MYCKINNWALQIGFYMVIQHSGC